MAQPADRLTSVVIDLDRVGVGVDHRNEDAGGRLRDGVKSLIEWGACSEATWKYESKLVFKKPTAKAYTEAAKHEITEYLKLNSLTHQAMADPSVKAKLADQGLEMVPDSPDEFRAYIASETEKWAKVIKDAGVETTK